MIKIRKATAADHDGIWEIIREVISTGDTYVFDPKTPKKMMLEYWCSAEKHTFVAVENGEIVGTFFFERKPARPRFARRERGLHGFADGGRAGHWKNDVRIFSGRSKTALFRSHPIQFRGKKQRKSRAALAKNGF